MFRPTIPAVNGGWRRNFRPSALGHFRDPLICDRPLPPGPPVFLFQENFFGDASARVRIINARPRIQDRPATAPRVQKWPEDRAERNTFPEPVRSRNKSGAFARRFNPQPTEMGFGGEP